VIQALDTFYALLTVSLLVPVLGGLYSKRAGAPEALAAIASGVVTLLVIRFFLAGRYGWLDPTLMGLVAAAVAFAVTMAVRNPESKIKNQKSKIERHA
jgi:Na+/pantothenate symporter